MKRLRAILPGIASAFVVGFGALAAVAQPEAPLSVSQWAGAHRVVGVESQSPHPGPWSNDRVPYTVEVMDACQLENGVRRVVIAGCAQFGKSEISLNALLWTIDYAPCGIMILLPSLEEARTWSRLKWEPNVEATPRIRTKVDLRKSRSAEGSTTMVKRFRGGSAEIQTAGASKGLQMRSYQLLACDEVDQYEAQVGVGGDPIDAAERGQLTFGDDAKTILSGTYGFKGKSRMEREFNASDMRRWYTPCPHCGGAQVLDFNTMALSEGRVVFSCIGCGCVIEEADKRRMNAEGFWLPAFEHPEADAEARARNPAPPKFIPAEAIDAFAPFSPERGYRFSVRDCEGRNRGYHLWQAQSNLSVWSVIWDKWQKVKAGLGDAIEFCQKILGEPYEEAVDRPDHERLHQARGILYRSETIGVPEWASIVTAAIDVQASRIEWAAYAYGQGGVGARIATAVIAKNPSDWTVWREDVARLVETTFSGPSYKARLADYWGIDSGGTATENVYNFCYPRQFLAHPVLSLKGSSHDKGDALPLARGNKVTVWNRGRRVGTMHNWFVGTYALKARVYHGLAQGLLAAEKRAMQPRALLYPAEATKEDFRQLTAEHLKRDDPRERGRWVKPVGAANEQLDLAVYCLALAWFQGLDRLNEFQWAQLAADRAPDMRQAELTPLERLMAPGDPPATDDDKPVDLTPPPAEGRVVSGPDDAARLAELARSFRGG